MTATSERPDTSTAALAAPTGSRGRLAAPSGRARTVRVGRCTSPTWWTSDSSTCCDSVPGELLEDKPLTAKIIASTVATLVAWVGNRYWTFAGRRTRTPARELVGFVVVNLIGMAAALGCLAFSHYVLGLTSPLADNIAANVVGVLVGTAIRYFAYRYLVFTGTGQTERVDSSS